MVFQDKESPVYCQESLCRLKMMMTLIVITVRLQVPLQQKANPAIAGVMISPTSPESPVQKLDVRGRQESKVSCLARASISE
jgi:hypothetical protein